MSFSGRSAGGVARAYDVLLQMTVLKLTLFVTLLGACSVGEVMGTGLGGDDTGGDDTMLPDASGSATPDAAAALKDTCAIGQTPGPGHDHGGGEYHTGESCMSGVACHAIGGAGGAWSFAGSAYTSAAAGLPQTGTVIRLLSADGTTLVAKTVTDDHGNFYSTTPIGAGPYITDITQCGASTEIRRMASPITGNHDCNGGTACHAIPGGTAIYLGP